MDEFLTYVITNGTAAAGGSQYARVSGKTGSAQYDSTKNYHAWFCGYGTNDVSEIAVCVMIEKGGAGGIVAAPVAGQVYGSNRIRNLQLTRNRGILKPVCVTHQSCAYCTVQQEELQ